MVVALVSKLLSYANNLFACVCTAISHVLGCCLVFHSNSLSIIHTFYLQLIHRHVLTHCVCCSFAIVIEYVICYIMTLREYRNEHNTLVCPRVPLKTYPVPISCDQNTCQTTQLVGTNDIIYLYVRYWLLVVYLNPKCCAVLSNQHTPFAAHGYPNYTRLN